MRHKWSDQVHWLTPPIRNNKCDFMNLVCESIVDSHSWCKWNDKTIFFLVLKLEYARSIWCNPNAVSSAQFSRDLVPFQPYFQLNFGVFTGNQIGQYLMKYKQHIFQKQSVNKQWLKSIIAWPNFVHLKVIIITVPLHFLHFTHPSSVGLSVAWFLGRCIRVDKIRIIMFDAIYYSIDLFEFISNIIYFSEYHTASAYANSTPQTALTNGFYVCAFGAYQSMCFKKSSLDSRTLFIRIFLRQLTLSSFVFCRIIWVLSLIWCHLNIKTHANWFRRVD